MGGRGRLEPLNGELPVPGALATGEAAGASGDGVERNQEMARSWYEKAAASGDGMALETLGLAYMSGDLGLQKDPERGRELLRQAADNGHLPARDLLESMDGTEAKTN